MRELQRRHWILCTRQDATLPSDVKNRKVINRGKNFYKNIYVSDPSEAQMLNMYVVLNLRCVYQSRPVFERLESLKVFIPSVCIDVKIVRNWY